MADDIWCDLCEERPAESKTQDGIAACRVCAANVIASIRGNRAARRAEARKLRRRNDGSEYAG